MEAALDLRLSVVIPTKNEAANIAACVRSFAQCRNQVEVLVVDNSSSDDTLKLAAAEGARTFTQGNERSAQRNRGWREAKGEWVLFLDADMILPAPTIAEILEICQGEALQDAWYIPEERAGVGLRARARNFERSFYNATCIDAVRLIRRSRLSAVGGYDEQLVACEDWDLDRRLLATGSSFGSLKGRLIHNEAQQGLGRLLAKKAYYAGLIGRYRDKWGEDAIIKRQFGLGYRFFGVFLERGNWRKVLKHPILFSVMMFERIAVGMVYLVRR